MEKIKLNKKMRFWGWIRGGEVSLNNRNLFIKRMSVFEDCPICLEVDRVRSKRSLAQNALYWGVWLPIIADYTGYSPEQLHQTFKDMFLPKETITINGKTRSIMGSTAKLSTSEFNEYLMRIEAEVAEMGISLPSSESPEFNQSQGNETKI